MLAAKAAGNLVTNSRPQGLQPSQVSKESTQHSTAPSSRIVPPNLGIIMTNTSTELTNVPPQNKVGDLILRYKNSNYYFVSILCDAHQIHQSLHFFNDQENLHVLFHKLATNTVTYLFP